MVELIGKAPCMQQLGKQIAKVAHSSAPVHISGPSGSGKEQVARIIHSLSPYKDKPFVPVNCGAIPKELMESEFFGHKKGSFTGAYHDNPGLFQTANGGTLFLDEIAALSLEMQVKLLRALQEKRIRPVGASHEVAVKVRILSATHQDLHSLVKAQLFREDLFYRINVIELKVPALKQRKQDIPLLTEAILAKQNPKHLPNVTDASMQALHNYDFPGNVRELENILERATTLCENQTITPADLQLPSPQPSHLPSFADTFSTHLHGSLDAYLNDMAKAEIISALEANNWVVTAAAQQLGMSFRSLRYKVKKLGIRQELTCINH